MDGDRQRIDRWLWHARVVRTRDLAKSLIEGGRVRVDRERQTRAGSPVRIGQVLTVTLPDRVRVLRVLGFVERRGSAEVASRLYEDLSPPSPREIDTGHTAVGDRDAGSGRPTKRDRRAIDRLTDDDES